jgi:hypothetical protein
VVSWGIPLAAREPALPEENNVATDHRVSPRPVTKLKSRVDVSCDVS